MTQDYYTKKMNSKKPTGWEGEPTRHRDAYYKGKNTPKMKTKIESLRDLETISAEMGHSFVFDNAIEAERRAERERDSFITKKAFEERFVNWFNESDTNYDVLQHRMAYCITKALKKEYMRRHP
jgi:hypothetical protein